MKIVYVAGPFRGPTHWDIVQNVRAAEIVALEIWRNGLAALCPHLNTANFQGTCPDSWWLDGDKEMLRRCDGVALIKGWERSAGAREEMTLAYELDIPIFNFQAPEGALPFAEWLRSLSVGRQSPYRR